MLTRKSLAALLAASFVLAGSEVRADDLARFSQITMSRQWTSYYSGDVSGSQAFTRRTSLDAKGTVAFGDGSAPLVELKDRKASSNELADVQFALAKAFADGLLKEIGDQPLAVPDSDANTSSFAITVVKDGKTYGMSGKDADAPRLPSLITALERVGTGKLDTSSDFTGTIQVRNGKAFLTKVTTGALSPVDRPLDDPNRVYPLGPATDVLQQLGGKTMKGNAFFDFEAGTADLWSLAGVAKEDVDLHKTDDPSSEVVDTLKKGDPMNLVFKYQKAGQVWAVHPSFDMNLKHLPGYAPVSAFGLGSDGSIEVKAPSKSAGLTGGLSASSPKKP